MCMRMGGSVRALGGVGKRGRSGAARLEHRLTLRARRARSCIRRLAAENQRLLRLLRSIESAMHAADGV